MKVGLFVTCLVDVARPSIGFAALKLLEAAGCQVVVPATQTCCGQPGYNSGARQVSIDLESTIVDPAADAPRPPPNMSDRPPPRPLWSSTRKINVSETTMWKASTT